MATLAFTSAACVLAQAIFYARSQAYGIAVGDWHTLSTQERQLYVDEAALTLESVKPADPNWFQVAAVLARQQGKVIGRITASEPWGESTI